MDLKMSVDQTWNNIRILWKICIMCNPRTHKTIWGNDKQVKTKESQVMGSYKRPASAM